MNLYRLPMLVVVLLASVTAAWSASSDEMFREQLQAAQTAVAATAAAQAIARITGVYHEEMKNHGEVVLSDDLQIAPFAEGAISFSVARQSYEGGRHSCGLSGVARYRKGRFVFTDTNAPLLGGLRCVLEIRLGSRGLELVDNGSCQDYCGAAITLDHAKFSFQGR